jgi:hypothetical protein
LGLLLVVASWGGVIYLQGCSAAEKHDSATVSPVPSCEASNTCPEAGSTSLPPITDPNIVAGPCASGKCNVRDGGGYEGSVSPVDDAASEAVAVPDAGAADVNDASHPADGGPG